MLGVITVTSGMVCLHAGQSCGEHTPGTGSHRIIGGSVMPRSLRRVRILDTMLWARVGLQIKWNVFEATRSGVKSDASSRSFGVMYSKSGITISIQVSFVGEEEEGGLRNSPGP